MFFYRIKISRLKFRGFSGNKRLHSCGAVMRTASGFCFLMMSVNDKTEHLKGSVIHETQRYTKLRILIFFLENYYYRL